MGLILQLQTSMSLLRWNAFIPIEMPFAAAADNTDKHLADALIPKWITKAHCEIILIRATNIGGHLMSTTRGCVWRIKTIVGNVHWTTNIPKNNNKSPKRLAFTISEPYTPPSLQPKTRLVTMSCHVMCHDTLFVSSLCSIYCCFVRMCKVQKQRNK